MKKSSWVVYLFEDEKHTQIFKIMEFRCVNDIAFCFNISSQTISNCFHGLIKPRGILKNCVIFQSINNFK